MSESLIAPERPALCYHGGWSEFSVVPMDSLECPVCSRQFVVCDGGRFKETHFVEKQQIVNKSQTCLHCSGLCWNCRHELEEDDDEGQLLRCPNCSWCFYQCAGCSNYDIQDEDDSPQKGLRCHECKRVFCMSCWQSCGTKGDFIENLFEDLDSDELPDWCGGEESWFCQECIRKHEPDLKPKGQQSQQNQPEEKPIAKNEGRFWH